MHERVMLGNRKVTMGRVFESAACSFLNICDLVRFSCDRRERF